MALERAPLVLIGRGFHRNITVFIHRGFSFVAFLLASALHSLVLAVHVRWPRGNRARGTAENGLLQVARNNRLLCGRGDICTAKLGENI